MAREDVEGSKDHPMVSRFPGAVIVGYAPPEYNEVVFPTGPLARKNNRFQYQSTITVEGQWTSILYIYPEGTSALEVNRNYERELRQKEVKIQFSCKKAGLSEVAIHLR